VYVCVCVFMHSKHFRSN